ncbi:MAG: Tetratricopeptide repeat [Planctomycetota bacterium]|jgi:predicted Zn-dependent protease
MTDSRIAGPALVTIVACVLSACGDGGASATRDRADAGKPADTRQTEQTPESGLSARELIDATDAIERFLNAGRTNEAVLIARRLVERAAADSAAEATANELCARACFTRAQLPDASVGATERRALTAEAAACALRYAETGEGDAGKLAFAALLCSNAARPDDARRLFDRALDLDPTNGPTLLQAALAALASGDRERAESLRTRRAAALPGDAWNDGIAAELALASDDASRAVESARRAVAADPDALEFRLILARALRRDGKPADAARFLSALDAAERAKPAIAEQFALALAESNDLAGAARAWDAALRANPADAYVRAETAIAFRRAGDEARAAAELAALEAIPGGAEQLQRIRPRLTAPMDGTPAAPR